MATFSCFVDPKVIYFHASKKIDDLLTLASIHLLIDCSPQHDIPDMIKALKGVSARLLMKEYEEELKKKLWGRHLWNPGYFAATVSENTEEQIRKYIQNQKVK